MGNLFSGDDFKEEAAEPEPEPEGYEAVEVTEDGGGAAGGSSKEGWLVKQGHLIKNWKRRWFVLEYPLLHYYRNPGDATPRGTVNCEQVTLSETAGMERTGREHCFMVHHPDRKIYFLQAEDEADMMSWVKAIRNERKVGLIDFEEISMIGKGNFGLVKLVRRKASQKLYAMKVLSKEQVIKRKDVEHTRTERNVLRRIRHPFVVQLRYAFQTGNKLYMVMDYVQGGDLYFHLRQEKKFKEPVVRLWIAELVLAYGYLHQLNVVFRDLKPENLLLDAEGHLHLADFGLSKQVSSHEQSLHTFCGTPYYLAPEIVQVSKTRGYGKAVDWWAIGVLMYELLTGQPPFQGANLQGVYSAIVHHPHSRVMNELRKSGVSAGAQALIIALLNRKPAERLGSGPTDAEEIRSHPYFGAEGEAPLDWDRLLAKEIPPGFSPTVASETDTSNFDHLYTRDKHLESVHLPDSSDLQGGGDTTFEGFTYHEAGTMAAGSGSLGGGATPRLDSLDDALDDS